jgi:hypothetical protein
MTVLIALLIGMISGYWPVIHDFSRRSFIQLAGFDVVLIGAVLAMEAGR